MTPFTRLPTKLALTLLLLTTAGACTLDDEGKTRETHGAPSDVEDVFLLTGELSALRSDLITCPRVEGWQAQIRWLAEDGAEVEAGDVVVEFDATEAARSIEERRSAVQHAVIEREGREQSVAVELSRRQAAVEKAEIEVKKARIDAAVPPDLRSVLENRRVEAMLMEDEAALEKARLELETYRISSRADVEIQKLSEEKARRALDTSEHSIAAARVTAPRKGIFMVKRHFQGHLDRVFQPGDNVRPGMPVATIPDLREMEVAAMLSEVDHGRIAQGMAARVVIDTFPERVFSGRVEEVGAVAPEVRNRAGFPVRVALDETDPTVMRPGLSVRVEVIRQKWLAALAVPRGAVRFEGALTFVRTAGLGGPRLVELLGCTPLSCAVKSGLAEGDRVLVD